MPSALSDQFGMNIHSMPPPMFQPTSVCDLLPPPMKVWLVPMGPKARLTGVTTEVEISKLVFDHWLTFA